MKRIVFILSLIIGVASCTNKDINSPTATIDGMVSAMKGGNIEEMKKFVSKTDLAMFEFVEQRMTSAHPEGVKRMKDSIMATFREKVKDVKYTLKNEKINGSTATVDAEVTEGGKTETHTINLLKEEGAWKVSLMNSQGGMFNSMKGNMGNDHGGIQEGLDRLNKMDPDSIKKLIDKGLQMMDSAKKQH